MKRFLFTLTALSVLWLTAAADDRDDYRQWAEQVRQEVWSKPLPAFQQRVCPDEYKKHSVVVLAAYEEVIVDQHNKADAAMLLLTWHALAPGAALRRLETVLLAVQKDNTSEDLSRRTQCKLALAICQQR